jgi:hypothetical protein
MLIDADYGGPSPLTAVDRLNVRRDIRDIIERSIDLLDALGPDPDFEEGDDGEPSLGSCETHPSASSWHTNARPRGETGGSQEHWADGAGDDREPDAGDDAEEVNEDGGDVNDEPHDACCTFDDIIADQDAADLLREELWFQGVMDRSHDDRLRAHDETRAAIARVTRRMPRSHWGSISRIVVRR